MQTSDGGDNDSIMSMSEVGGDAKISGKALLMAVLRRSQTDPGTKLLFWLSKRLGFIIMLSQALVPGAFRAITGLGGGWWFGRTWHAQVVTTMCFINTVAYRWVAAKMPPMACMHQILFQRPSMTKQKAATQHVKWTRCASLPLHLFCLCACLCLCPWVCR